MKYPSLIVLLLVSLSLYSQSYDLTAGLRLGTDWGISAQFRMPYVHKNFTIETILQSSLQRDEGLLTILGEQHTPILSRRLNIYTGAGLHFGWSNEVKEDASPVKNPIGISGIVGAEANFGQLNLSYDLKPAINISGGSRTIYAQTAVTVRYIIAKRNGIFDKQKEKERRKARNKRRRIKKREERGKRWYEFWKKGN